MRERDESEDSKEDDYDRMTVHVVALVGLTMNGFGSGGGWSDGGDGGCYSHQRRFVRPDVVLGLEWSGYGLWAFSHGSFGGSKRDRGRSRWYSVSVAVNGSDSLKMMSSSETSMPAPMKRIRPFGRSKSMEQVETGWLGDGRVIAQAIVTGVSELGKVAHVDSETGVTALGDDHNGDTGVLE
jgi:hypothetical protein